jgi:hypothetical protein
MYHFHEILLLNRIYYDIFNEDTKIPILIQAIMLDIEHEFQLMKKTNQSAIKVDIIRFQLPRTDVVNYKSAARQGTP